MFGCGLYLGLRREAGQDGAEPAERKISGRRRWRASFYPRDPRRAAGGRCCGPAGAAAPASAGASPKALIAPHAGYVYSGGCRRRGVRDAQIRQARDESRRGDRAGALRRGPRHRGADGRALRDAARPRAGRSATRSSAIDDLPFVVATDCSHAPEHALEVELPFLQALLGRSARAAAWSAMQSRRRWPRCCAAVGRGGDADRRELGSVALSRLRDGAAARCRDGRSYRARRVGGDRAGSGVRLAGGRGAADGEAIAAGSRRAGWRCAIRATPRGRAIGSSDMAPGNSRTRRREVTGIAASRDEGWPVTFRP